MDINFKQIILNLKGKPMKEDVTDDEGVRTGSRDLFLGTIAINALANAVESDDNQRPVKVDAQEKVRRARLAQKIYGAVEDGEGTLSLKVEDVTLIKRLIGIAYPPLIVAAAYDLIEPEKESKPNDGTSAGG